MLGTYVYELERHNREWERENIKNRERGDVGSRPYAQSQLLPVASLFLDLRGIPLVENPSHPLDEILWRLASMRVSREKRSHRYPKKGKHVGPANMQKCDGDLWRTFAGGFLEDFSGLFLGAKTSTQTFFAQSFSKTLRAMDVRAKNRGRPHQKVRFSAAPVMGRNFLTQGRPGVRVRNVRGKSGPKSLCLCCFFFPDFFLHKWDKSEQKAPWKKNILLKTRPAKWRFGNTLSILQGQGDARTKQKLETRTVRTVFSTNQKGNLNSQNDFPGTVTGNRPFML